MTNKKVSYVCGGHCDVGTKGPQVSSGDGPGTTCVSMPSKLVKPPDSESEPLWVEPRSLDL